MNSQFLSQVEMMEQRLTEEQVLRQKVDALAGEVERLRAAHPVVPVSDEDRLKGNFRAGLEEAKAEPPFEWRMFQGVPSERVAAVVEEGRTDAPFSQSADEAYHLARFREVSGK